MRGLPLNRMAALIVVRWQYASRLDYLMDLRMHIGRCHYRCQKSEIRGCSISFKKSQLGNVYDFRLRYIEVFPTVRSMLRRFILLRC